MFAVPVPALGQASQTRRRTRPSRSYQIVEKVHLFLPRCDFLPLLNYHEVGADRVHTDKNQPTDGLSLLCVVLHLVLVILHIMLLVVCISHLEHLIVFPLDWQSLISPTISGVMTTFASVNTKTVFISVNVFIDVHRFIVRPSF